MKRVMVWMWEHNIETVDAKGKKVFVSAFSEKPIEGGKRRRIAHYREKEHRRKSNEI